MPEDMESIFDKIMIHYKPVLCLIGSKLILYPHTHADLLRLIFYCLVQGRYVIIKRSPVERIHWPYNIYNFQNKNNADE